MKQYENRGNVLEDFQMYDLAAKQKKSDVSSQGTGNESLTPLLTPDPTYKVKELIHKMYFLRSHFVFFVEDLRFFILPIFTKQ